MGNEQKKRSSKKFWLYIQNGGDDIQKWANLSTFWKMLALGYTVYTVQVYTVYCIVYTVYSIL